MLAVVLTLLGIASNPMLLIYPMWIVTSLERERLRRLVGRLPAGVAFVGSGLVFGLITETFAILNNRHRPPEERILLSPDPLHDLVFGVFYDLMLILTWWLLIRAMRYSKLEVVVITGLLGIMTEEMGQVFVRIFVVPVVGPLYALIVATVYGIFPMLAYLLSEPKFVSPKRSNVVVRFLAAALALFVQWAVYGLFILPALKRIV